MTPANSSGDADRDEPHVEQADGLARDEPHGLHQVVLVQHGRGGAA